MKTVLIIVFCIMFGLKLASVGAMATASWWLVFSPLILIASWYLFFGVLMIVALAGIFPKLSLWIARSLHKK